MNYPISAWLQAIVSQLVLLLGTIDSRINTIYNSDDLFTD
jgi:hypothetical protein